MTDIAYRPTCTDRAVQAVLASIYSGAGLVEARALIDQLEDRGLRVGPSLDADHGLVRDALSAVYGDADLGHARLLLGGLWSRGYGIGTR